MKRLQNLALLLITLFLCTFAAEGALRLIFRDVTTTSAPSYFTTRWKEQVRTNRHGFREREFEATPTDGVYRIALIGDSFSYGQGIEEADRLSNIIEERLNENGSARFEVLNFAKPGMETLDHLAVLRDPVLSVEPAFVLFQWFANDFEGWDKSGRPKTRRLLPSRQLQVQATRHSVVFYLCNRAWGLAQKALGPVERYSDYMRGRFADPESPDSRRAIAELDSVWNLCDEHDLPFAIVTYPDLADPEVFAYLQQRVWEHCDRRGVPYVDPTPGLVAHRGEPGMVANRFDTHPGRLANEVVAEAVIEVLGSRWMEMAERTGNE